MCFQDLKTLRTQLYYAAEYFEVSYTNDDHKETCVPLILLNMCSLFKKVSFFFFDIDISSSGIYVG